MFVCFALFAVSLHAEERYPVGANASVSGGINFHQHGSHELENPPTGLEEVFDIDGGMGWAVSGKLGYTWASFDEMLNFDTEITHVNGGFRVMPALEFEFLYTSLNDMETSDDSFLGTGTSAMLEPEIDIYLWSLNALCKFQIENFRPYIGGGVGFAYMKAGDVDGTLSGGGWSIGTIEGEDDDIVPALQALAGMEVFLDEAWGLLLEYKFLYLVDPEFESFNGALTHRAASFCEHFLMAGVRYYF
jgi:opacity protein-like surface antigen